MTTLLSSRQSGEVNLILYLEDEETEENEMEAPLMPLFRTLVDADTLEEEEVLV